MMIWSGPFEASCAGVVFANRGFLCLSWCLFREGAWFPHHDLYCGQNRNWACAGSAATMQTAIAASIVVRIDLAVPTAIARSYRPELLTELLRTPHLNVVRSPGLGCATGWRLLTFDDFAVFARVVRLGLLRFTPPRLAMYSLPSIGATCGGSRSRYGRPTPSSISCASIQLHSSWVEA